MLMPVPVVRGAAHAGARSGPGRGFIKMQAKVDGGLMDAQMPRPLPVISSHTHPRLPLRGHCDGDIQRRTLLLQLHAQAQRFRGDQTAAGLDR